MGTFVEITASHSDESLVHQAIDGAFLAISLVEKSMNAHDPESELSLLNQRALSQDVQVSPDLYTVLAFSKHLYERSSGVFDVAIYPGHSCDLVLKNNGAVRFSSPLRLDLSGVAKGFAVDRAIAALQNFPLDSGLVNAGGDLRYFGNTVPELWVRLGGGDHASLDFMETSKKALATSTPSAKTESRAGSLHHHGVSGVCVPEQSITVTVFAQSCMIADALTKIVTNLQDEAQPILDHFDAIAVAIRHAQESQL